MARPALVIVGGGYAGVETARKLRDRLDVTIVSDDNYLLFTPMLAEVAAGDLDPRHIVSPIRQLCPHARLVVGVVTQINVEGSSVVVSRQVDGEPIVVEGDTLLLTLGSVRATYDVEGVDEHTVSFKTISDALLIRNRLVAYLEAAAHSGEDHLTKVAIVGAGYSGAELAGALADFLSRSHRRFYPAAPAPRVTLIDAADRVVPGLPSRGSRAAHDALERRGVELLLGTQVASVDNRGVTLADGRRAEGGTRIWVAGVRPNPLVQTVDLQTEGARLAVNSNLRVPGIEVFAAGDAAAVPDGRGGISPPTGQFALRQGRYLGKHLPDLLEGKAVPPFRYRSRGQLVSLGHRHAVGVVLGVPVSGFVAWFMWRSYYLFRLPTLLRKVRVAFDWTLDLLFPPDIAGLPTSEIGPPAR